MILFVWSQSLIWQWCLKFFLWTEWCLKSFLWNGSPLWLSWSTLARPWEVVTTNTPTVTILGHPATGQFTLLSVWPLLVEMIIFCKLTNFWIGFLVQLWNKFQSQVFFFLTKKISVIRLKFENLCVPVFVNWSESWC